MWDVEAALGSLREWNPHSAWQVPFSPNELKMQEQWVRRISCVDQVNLQATNAQ